MNVHSCVAGLNQPEAGGVTAVLEEPVSGRDSDVRGSRGEHGQVFPGHAVQERVGGQSRRRDLNHDHHRQLVLLSRYTLVQLSADGQGRRSPSTGTMGRR
jgi:hypothetical protein